MTATWRRVAAMCVVVVVAVVVLVVAVGGVAVGVGAGAAPAAADRPAALCADRDPIAASLAGELARHYPGQRFSAAVVDSATGCSYHLNPSLRMTTASVVKLEVLAGVVLRAAVDEVAGRINRPMADRPWSGPGIGAAGSGLDIAARHRVSGSLLHGELTAAPSTPWRDAGGSITSAPMSPPR